MVLTLFNTLTRRKEPFRAHGNKLGFYSCGPTVHNYAHIGNFRAYVFADLLKRYLTYKGFEVNHVMNITDVDDKTIKNSQAKTMSLQAFTEKYTQLFFEDLDSLNIRRANTYPRATEHIKEMIDITTDLLKKGVAYKAHDGIYFAISKFPTYGNLAHIDLSQLKAGARVANDEYDKDNVQDFALWKFHTAKDGDVAWDAPFGKGRPGWHIECSAMAMRYLGHTFDIHSGGIDLVFPHHQNEVAQSEASTGKQFVRYWLHNEHLIVEGKKMSKSLGNFYTLRDILKKGYSPGAVRYQLLSVHYRQQLNFTFESLKAAQSSIDRINDFYARMVERVEKQKKETLSEAVKTSVEQLKKSFEVSLDDDLNVSAALAAVHEFVTQINAMESKLTEFDALEVVAVMDAIDTVLGIIQFVEEPIPQEIQLLVEERELARKQKDFARSDALREKINSYGYTVDDGKDGVRVKKSR